MKFDYHDCIKEGLLRRVVPSKDKARRSFKKAERWLEESEKNFSTSSFNSCIISSYFAMFHAARAVLIKDGFREKSHYCVARYLEEKYVKVGKLEEKWVDLLDRCRDLRHVDQYDVSFYATKDDAGSILKLAKEFIKRLNKLLSKNVS